MSESEEGSFELHFSGSAQLGIRLAPLTDEKGCSFDGWVPGALRPDDSALLEVGDRLASVNGDDVLESPYEDIVSRLLRDPSQPRTLTWLRPVDACEETFDEETLGMWLEPLSESLTGALLTGFSSPDVEAAHPEVRVGMVLLAVDGRAVAGLVFEEILKSVQLAPRPRKLRFGFYRRGADKVRAASVAKIAQLDTLRAVLGQPFAERQSEIFCESVRCGDVAYVRRRLQGGQSVHACDHAGIPAIHCAVESRDVSMVELLVAEGCDINERDSNDDRPLHRAVSLGFEAIVRVLLRAGATLLELNRNGQTVLHCAAQYGFVSMVRLLLTHASGGGGLMDRITAPGATKGSSLLQRRIVEGRSGGASSPSGGGRVDGRRQPRLSIALSAGGPPPDPALLAFVNARDGAFGWTALHYAARGGQSDIVRLLLELHADPHVRSAVSRAPPSPSRASPTAAGDVEEPVRAGRTALRLAREAGAADVAGILHEAVMREPLHPVWPRGAEWTVGVPGVDVAWRHSHAEFCGAEEAQRRAQLLTSRKALRAERARGGSFYRSVRPEGDSGARVSGRGADRMPSVMGQRRNSTASVFEDDEGNSEGVEDSDSEDFDSASDSSYSYSTTDDTERHGEVWLGCRTSCEEGWVDAKGIGAVLTLLDGATLDMYPKLRWLADAERETEGRVVWRNAFLRDLSSEDGWKAMLMQLPSMIAFVWKHFKAGRRVLVASAGRANVPLSRSSAVVLAVLVTKLRVALKDGVALLRQRCYFFNYKDAKLKQRWLRTEEKELTVSHERCDEIYRDSNTKCGKERDWGHNADGWVPYVGARTDVNKGFMAGLETLQNELFARKLKRSRRQQIEFAKEFLTC